MKNWNNNLTYETALIVRVNNTQNNIVYTYEDYEPRGVLI